MINSIANTATRKGDKPQPFRDHFASPRRFQEADHSELRRTDQPAAAPAYSGNFRQASRLLRTCLDLHKLSRKVAFELFAVSSCRQIQSLLLAWTSEAASETEYSVSRPVLYRECFCLELLPFAKSRGATVICNKTQRD